MIASSDGWLDDRRRLRRHVAIGQRLADVLALDDPRRIQGDPDRLEARNVLAALADALGIEYEPSADFEEATTVEIVLGRVAPELERDLRSGGALAAGEALHWDDVAFGALRPLEWIDDLHEIIMVLGYGDTPIASTVRDLQDHLERVATEALAIRLRELTKSWRVKGSVEAGRKARRVRSSLDRPRRL